MICHVGGDNQIAYDTTHKPGRKIKQIAQTALINENGYLFSLLVLVVFCQWLRNNALYH